jgi:hypothetical protein
MFLRLIETKAVRAQVSTHCIAIAKLLAPATFRLSVPRLTAGHVIV